MTDLAELRARARRHEEEILSLHWFTSADLAARWQVSRSTVLAIPRDELPYKAFGAGKKLQRRRYREDAVLAYEMEAGLTPPSTPSEGAA